MKDLLKEFRIKIESYFSTSYRRKKIDAILEKHRHLYTGVVLDIGGRDRGNFKKPKTSVKKWIFADIVKEFHPDIVLDVTDMHNVESNSIDVVNAIELFEHVSDPEKGISECYRVLRTGGIFIASTPFLYGIHADPYDFQRWTNDKWRIVLEKTGFTAIECYAMGTGISVSFDMIKGILRHSNTFIKLTSFFIYPILDFLERADELEVVRKSFCGKYVGGYFIVAKK